MSTTLSTHPPQQAAREPQQVASPVSRPTSRPNVVDKLALRLGLWLITYGRRRYAQPEKAGRRPEIHVPDRAWDRSGWLPRPGA